MTLQEPRTPHSADAPDTQVMIVPLAPAPVFVDSTGRRRRLLRRASYAFGGLVMLYAGLVSVSLAGGPVSPSAVLGLPNLADGSANTTGDDVLTRPSPIPDPTASAPKPVFVADALPRRTAPATGGVKRTGGASRPSTTASKTPKPSKSPSPSPLASTRPVESTTTPSAPSSGRPQPSTPVSTPAPEPPAGTGGSGGGSSIEDVAGSDGSAVEDVADSGGSGGGSGAGSGGETSGSAGSGGETSGSETIAEPPAAPVAAPSSPEVAPATGAKVTA